MPPLPSSLLPRRPPSPCPGLLCQAEGSSETAGARPAVGRSNGRALTVHPGAPLGLLLPALIQLISGLPPEGPSLTLDQGGSALGPQNSMAPRVGVSVPPGDTQVAGWGCLAHKVGHPWPTGEPCSLGRAEDWEAGWAAPKGQGCACGSPSPGGHAPRAREQGLQNGLLLGGRTPLASGLPSVPTAAAGSLHGPSAHLLLVRF